VESCRDAADGIGLRIAANRTFLPLVVRGAFGPTTGRAPLLRCWLLLRNLFWRSEDGSVPLDSLESENGRFFASRN
jgi:hypothetical protein